MSAVAALSAGFAPPLLPAAPAELRIDVELPGTAIDADLRRLQQRLRTPGDALHHTPREPSGLPGLVLRHREADGELFVYVQDSTLDRLAGVMVFNRLVELKRRPGDRVLRSPHTRIAPPYRRRGLARAVYTWALARGLCLLSGPRQSPGAHALWRSLAQQHPLGFVALRDKRLQWLGPEVDETTLEDFHTRMVLLGAGWDAARFFAQSGCEGGPPAPALAPGA
jgi:GNAT superfamily N-acetyltransferase